MKKRIVSFFISVCMLAAMLMPMPTANALGEGEKKSQNFNLGSYSTATSGSNWNKPANMTDGDFTTTNNGGNHSNGNWVWYFQMNNTTVTLRYNKVMVFYTQYNTEYLELKTGTSVSNNVAQGGLTLRKNLNYDYKTTNPPMKQVFSFDAVGDNYISLNNKYWKATNISGDEYNGKNATISEVQVYYVLPDKVVIDSGDSYFAEAGTVIETEGKVVDVDGDEILDSEFSGLNWSVEGSDKVSIDPGTGRLTVNEALDGDVTVTVKAEMTAAGYSGYYATKNIRLTSGQISSIEIKDVPDFIMTNREQNSVSTFYPSAVAYGHDGSPMSGQSFQWSLKEPVDGVEVIEADSGVFTVKSTAAAEAEKFTLICKAAVQGESASDEVTVQLNQKVDLMRNKIGWTASGWQVTPTGTVGKAVDGSSSTEWNSGTHARGTATAHYDIGETVNANYFRLKLGNTANSSSLRIAGSTALQGSDNSLDVTAPTTADRAYVSGEVMPGLYPRNGDAKKQGNTYWSARSADAPEDAALEQENILSGNDIYSYFKDGTEKLRYISIINYARDTTENCGIFSVPDFEVYNTSPNYAAITLPEDADISTAGASVNMEAVIHNGVAPEAAESTGTWSATAGFTIDPQTGALTVPGGKSFRLGTITYTYESDILDARTTIYVCTDNGTLKFANDPNEFLGLQFAGEIKTDGSTLYVPEGTTAENLRSGINSTRGDIDIYVADKNGNEVESGTVGEGYTVKVRYDDINIIYSVAFQSDLAINITKDGSNYTASTLLRGDISNATIILTEYSGKNLVQVATASKTSEQENLSVTLNGVEESNTVKAMLFDSLGGMRPLCPAKTQE